MKVYKIRQDHAQATLHERLTEDHLAKEKLQACQHALHKSSDLADCKHAQPQCVDELLQHRMYLNFLGKEVNQQKEICSQTQNEVDKARDVLIEANRRTQTMENLKTRQFNQFQQDMLRKEQVILDEIGLNKKKQL
jgi:flagellar export protein FliJ